MVIGKVWLVFYVAFFATRVSVFLYWGRRSGMNYVYPMLDEGTKVRRSAFTASDAGSRPELDDLLFLYAVRDLVRGVQQVQSSPLPIKFQGRHHGLRRPTSSEKWEEKRMEA